jgi:SAM-dependent methyltransferase
VPRGPAAESLYTREFAAFYELYNTGWTRDFTCGLIEYLTGSRPPARSVLDLCCGTGVAAFSFCEAGWEVVGIDRSAGMLSIARERLAAYLDSGRARLIEASATAFDPQGPLGAGICLDGPLNHLETPGELATCFAVVHESLYPGARFVFDLYEPGHFRRHWAKRSRVEEGEVEVERSGEWDEGARAGTFRVAGRVGEARVEQSLWSRTFTSAEVSGALREAGFVPDGTLTAADAGCRSPACAGATDACRTVYVALRPR